MLALPDSPAWVAAFLGAARVGATCALVSTALPAERAREAIARMRPRLVLSDDDALAQGCPGLGGVELR